MTTITHLDYTVCIDGGPTDFGTTLDPQAALAEAERIKREDPQALVTLVIDTP